MMAHSVRDYRFALLVFSSRRLALVNHVEESTMTKEMYVCCTMKGTPLMVECTTETIKFISAVVKSQIEAGGVAPKRKCVDKAEREEIGVPGATTLPWC